MRWIQFADGTGTTIDLGRVLTTEWSIVKASSASTVHNYKGIPVVVERALSGGSTTRDHRLVMKFNREIPFASLRGIFVAPSASPDPTVTVDNPNSVQGSRVDWRVNLGYITTAFDGAGMTYSLFSSISKQGNIAQPIRMQQTGGFFKKGGADLRITDNMPSGGWSFPTATFGGISTAWGFVLDPKFDNVDSFSSYNLTASFNLANAYYFSNNIWAI